ncbi:MAG: hypothetical protein NTV23_10855 [Propionibacteriales bacterium]|nr:hypothetical protein [Propionibacteriales bacterium]
MTPLQKIAMGLVIVFAPGYFEIAGQPYDVLADWLGWLLVLAGVGALSRHLEVDLVRWLARVALVVSLVFWFPQVTDLLPDVDGPVKGVDPSVQWFISLPQAAFSLLLVQAIGKAAINQVPRDSFVAGRYGVLTWAFIAGIVLPPVAYAVAEDLIRPTLIGIALINLALIYQLFRVHRRTWLGGPGPLEVHPEGPRSGNDEGRPD